MPDRCEIRWAPFNSVIDSKILVNEIRESNRKVIKPSLSEDELEEINNKIIEAYHNASIISIYYFYKGSILNKKGIIECIKLDNKKIILNDYSSVYFDQIIKIES